MGARAGQFDRRVTLRRPSEVVDEFGGRRTVYVDAATVWARRMPAGGGRSVPTDTPTAASSVVFEIRFVAGVGPRWVLVYEAAEYEIVNVEEGKARRETLILSTVARDTGAGAR